MIGLSRARRLSAAILALAAGCISETPGGGFDARFATCDPIVQTGCAAGEKCSVILPPESSTADGVTECLPDGSIGAGEPCELVTREDGSRIDECAAPLVCGPERVCTPACQFGVRGSCGDEATCIAVNHYFEDVTAGRVGMCVPQCDPVDAGATCPDGRGCYPYFPTAEFLCAVPAEGAAGLRFMDECEPRASSDVCFINSAPVGAVSFLALDWEEQAAAVPRVAPFCRAISTHAGSGDPENTARGDSSLQCGPSLLGSAGAQCRHLNSIYSNEELALIPDGVGLCVPTGGSSPPGTGYNDSVSFDLEAWAANPRTALNPDGVPYCPGCLTRDELAAALEKAGGEASLRALAPAAIPVQLSAIRAALAGR